MRLSHDGLGGYVVCEAFNEAGHFRRTSELYATHALAEAALRTAQAGLGVRPKGLMHSPFARLRAALEIANLKK